MAFLHTWCEHIMLWNHSKTYSVSFLQESLNRRGRLDLQVTTISWLRNTFTNFIAGHATPSLADCELFLTCYPHLQRNKKQIQDKLKNIIKFGSTRWYTHRYVCACTHWLFLSCQLQIDEDTLLVFVVFFCCISIIYFDSLAIIWFGWWYAHCYICTCAHWLY